MQIADAHHLENDLGHPLASIATSLVVILDVMQAETEPHANEMVTMIRTEVRPENVKTDEERPHLLLPISIDTFQVKSWTSLSFASIP